MQERKINLEEILNRFSSSYGIVTGNPRAIVLASEAISAMKEACQQVLELVAENANLIPIGDWAEDGCELDKQSILNVINQVE